MEQKNLGINIRKHSLSSSVLSYSKSITSNDADRHGKRHLIGSQGTQRGNPRMKQDMNMM